MPRDRCVRWGASLVFVVGAASLASAQSQPARGLINTYCVGCHNEPQRQRGADPRGRGEDVQGQQQLIDAHPHDLDAAASAAAVAAALGDSKRVAAWLRRALVSGPRASAARIADGDDEQDPRRADLWRQLGDAERAVGNFDAAEFAYRRATALAPDSDGALAARRGLVGLADEDSNITSESSLFALVEFEQDPDDVLAWARTLSRGNDTDAARAGFELARAL